MISTSTLAGIGFREVAARTHPQLEPSGGDVIEGGDHVGVTSGGHLMGSGVAYVATTDPYC
ncbi:MAG: hypothetical protein ACKVIY_09890, partial [Acidimicrobiales bacterium]